MENLPPSVVTGPVTDAEKTYIIDTLKTTRDELHQSLRGLSMAQLTYKPNPDRWSIYECTEHIALVENGIFGGIRAGMEAPAEPNKRADINVSDVDVIKAMRSRVNTRLAPAPTEPTGRFGDPAGALQAFDQLRNSAIDFVTTVQDDLRTHYFINRVFGVVDAYQGFLMLASHSARHRKQIEEIKASTDFPVVNA